MLAEAAHKTGRGKIDFEILEITKERYEKLKHFIFSGPVMNEETEQLIQDFCTQYTGPKAIPFQLGDKLRSQTDETARAGAGIRDNIANLT